MSLAQYEPPEIDCSFHQIQTLQAYTIASGKKLLMTYAKQPMKMHRGLTPNKLSH